MLVNKLSLNIKKTKYMLFSDDIILQRTHWKRWTFQIVRCDHWFKIIMGRSYPIYKKRKFPKDFEFNARLKEFYNHLRWLYYTIVSHIRKAKRVLQSPTMVILYYSFTHPFMLYCTEIWGFASKECLMSIFRRQKRALCITHSNRNSPNVSILGITICIWNIYIQNCNVYV